MSAMVAAADPVAVGVTVVATLVVVGLIVAVVALVRAAVALRREAEALAEAMEVGLASLDRAVVEADGQLRRVEDLVGSAESIGEALGSASRLASSAVSTPVIKVMAMGTGAARAGRRLREGAAPPASRRATRTKRARTRGD